MRDTSPWPHGSHYFFQTLMSRENWSYRERPEIIAVRVKKIPQIRSGNKSRPDPCIILYLTHVPVARVCPTLIADKINVRSRERSGPVQGSGAKAMVVILLCSLRVYNKHSSAPPPGGRTARAFVMRLSTRQNTRRRSRENTRHRDKRRIFFRRSFLHVSAHVM